MSNTKLNEKSALARLLATENLTVHYSAKYQTAFFDLKNRSIHIPLFNDLDEDILDLFEGHEVGHARETPPEGFHSAIHDNGEFNETLKSYINVVEDIRIERKIKAEYPGLRRSFANGYKKLVARNFFGQDIQAKINSMPFIDKLNIEAKVGAHILVILDDEEKSLVEEAYTLETWDEVVAFAKKLIAREKALKKKQQSETQDNAQNAKAGDEESLDSNEQPDTDSTDQQDKQACESGDGDDEVTPSQTDQIFRENEKQLFASAKTEIQNPSTTSASITINKYNLSNYVVPASKLAPVMSKLSRTMFNASENAKDLGTFDQFITDRYMEYRKDNEAYVNFLIKEFEMRKNAQILNRGKVSKSGKIDVRRVHKYRLSDDVFKRVMNYPEGKNHGMNMYIDLSASMYLMLDGVFTQVLILSDFCRKVGIPFRVYGFSDSVKSIQFVRAHIDPNFGNDRNDESSHSYAMNDNVHLKEYISSELNSRDYKVAFNNILMIQAYYAAYSIWNSNYRLSHNLQPEVIKAQQIYHAINADIIGERLGSTPLNDAIVLSQQITNEFVAKYGIENMVNIILTDGEDDSPNSIVYNPQTVGEGVQQSRRGYIHRSLKHSSMITHYNGTRYVVKPRECNEGFSTYHILKMARKITGARYIGYYLTDDSKFLYKATCHDAAANKYINWQTHHRILKAKYRRDKFLHSTTYGYNDYFYISSTGTVNDSDDDDNWFDSLGGGVSKSRLSKAFIDRQTKKQLNRILLVNFGRAIAEAA